MLALPALANSEKVTEPALLIVALPADPLSPMNRKPLLSMVAVPAVELPRMLVKPVLVIVTPVRSPLATSSDPAKATVTAPAIDPARPPSRAELQRAGRHRRAAAVGLGAFEDQDAVAGLAQAAGAVDEAAPGQFRAARRVDGVGAAIEQHQSRDGEIAGRPERAAAQDDGAAGTAEIALRRYFECGGGHPPVGRRRGRAGQGPGAGAGFLELAEVAVLQADIADVEAAGGRAAEPQGCRPIRPERRR